MSMTYKSSILIPSTYTTIIASPKTTYTLKGLKYDLPMVPY